MVSNKTCETDGRISKYIEAAKRLQQGHYNLEIPAAAGDDEISRLGLALQG